MRTWICLVVICMSSMAFADHHEHAAKVSPEFESMKALVGTWTGKIQMNGKEEEMKVTYELTSGGTALVEKLNPGTPMEMITVYANNGKTVQATHYCSLGNQPQLKLKAAKNNAFTFEMVGNKGIGSKKDMHMRGVTLTLDGNKLKQEWLHFKDGKKNEVVSFELAKKI